MERLETGPSWRDALESSSGAKKIAMRGKEAIDGAIEHNDFRMLIRLDRGDDLVEPRDRFRSEERSAAEY